MTKINEIQRKYLIEKGEELSIVELSKKLNVTKEEIVMAIDSVRPIDSVDKEIYEEETETKMNTINVQKDETTELVNRLCLTEMISNLEKRDRKIIVLRYILEKTQNEVAKILGITQVQVSRLEKKILTRMRSKIEV
jgi:RNA polymerase sporulation-specific sigma factor